MSDLPRIVTIMGSGETTPTMSRVHRAILDRLGPRPVPAVVLDTPYGFQENADDITERAQEYFRDSVGHPLRVASLRAAGDDPLTVETALARIREARYVFAGPGSPTYALRHWRATPIPRLLGAKLETGGAVTAASAAALTLGRYTLPVYEIYKAGEEPRWLDGLDLLTPLGLPVAVIPHYDNAEGGTHDTRYCYLGERRLRMLEADLPEDVFVLGVDGHTALVLDLDTRRGTVLGLGAVTVRKDGRSATFPAGSEVSIEDLVAASRPDGTAAAGSGNGSAPRPILGAAAHAVDTGSVSPLAAEVAGLERDFDAALGSEPSAAVQAALALDSTLLEWSRDTEQSEVLSSGRDALRAMIVRLGEAAGRGGDPRATMAPFVDALVELRLRARESRDWALADTIRDRLLAAGIEVHDTADGTTWGLRQSEQVR